MSPFWNYAVWVGALGYFVDVFDLVIFSVVRQKSLIDLGVAPENVLEVGAHLFNLQLAGLLVGGFAWGWISDRFGRKAGLYGSIFIYSAANLLNAGVTSLLGYEFCRAIAGFGLAGELGAALTLVVEVLPPQSRTHGTTLVVGMGLLGAICASLTGEYLGWRIAFLTGGLLGVALLLARFALPESPLFLAQSKRAGRGSLLVLFSSARRIRTYFCAIVAGVPIWFVMGVLVTFAPEIAADGGVNDVKAGLSVTAASLGILLGNVASGLLTHVMKSRRGAIWGGMLAATFSLGLLWVLGSRGWLSPAYWYAVCFLLAVGTGYGGVLFTLGAEAFGTNLRALVTTSASNLVRGSALITVSLFLKWKLGFGPWKSALLLGGLCLGLAALAVLFLEETYLKDLDYAE